MWLDQFQFAGFYVAKEKGFYKDLGLDVELKKFNDSTNVLDEVMEGKADFGLNSTSLIIEKSNGKDIVLLASVFQSSPLVLLALKNSNINSIQDIKNKNTDLLFADKTNEPFILKEKGYESISFHPKDFNFDFYEQLIFTSKEFANKNPKLVKDFYDASIKGWEYAFKNIEEVAKLVFEKYNPQNKSLESLIFEAKEMKKLVYDNNNKIGTITKDKINLIANTYKVLGLMKNHIDINDLIYTKHLENSFFLNEEEVHYLNNKGPLKICVNPNWLPFEKIENNEYIGITADYINLIKEKINTNIKIIPSENWTETLKNAKNRTCDILPIIVKTQDRTSFLDFTSSYINLPLVMAGALE